ncbi:DMT family transporter [Pelagibius marinus]|uniref:DMT family transporter n=1 Tax=Pelagibius marinus TaxID=2762760 RepID=UPI0018731F64|nr:DMT family transporter [Pelagibius marinus]
MSEFAVALVLSAAVLHATWNAIVKGTRARALVLAAVAGTHGTVGLLMLLWFELPQPASWPYIAASATTHYGYYYFLSLAYKWGDLSRVYPISRGIAPLLVSLGALIFAGEQLSALGWGGVALVSAGICLLAFFSKGPSVPDPRSTGAAVATGLIIASYSVIDGIGVRLSGSPFGYIGWLFFTEFLVTLFVLARLKPRFTPEVRATLRVGYLGGLCAVAAYALVIYANTLAPLGMVSALRESSVIIAALFGVVIFRERPWISRLAAAVTVGAGVLVLTLTR